jgi:hypothetical protein
MILVCEDTTKPVGDSGEHRAAGRVARRDLTSGLPQNGT